MNVRQVYKGIGGGTVFLNNKAVDTWSNLGVKDVDARNIGTFKRLHYRNTRIRGGAPRV